MIFPTLYLCATQYQLIYGCVTALYCSVGISPYISQPPTKLQNPLPPASLPDSFRGGKNKTYSELKHKLFKNKYRKVKERQKDKSYYFNSLNRIRVSVLELRWRISISSSMKISNGCSIACLLLSTLITRFAHSPKLRLIRLLCNQVPHLKPSL